MRRGATIMAVAMATAAAAALTAAAALAGPTGTPVTAPDGNAQAIGAALKPRKLFAKSWTPAALEVTARVTNAIRPGGVPSPTTHVVIDFPKSGRVSSKGFPTCEAAKLQNVSTEVAERECRSALIGRGTAEALLPVGSQVFAVPQEVTAFNGVPRGGRPVVLLHSYGAVPVQTALVLTGVVTNLDKEGYGPRLDVEVPLIAGGAGALTYFNVTVQKQIRRGGKNVSYIQAKCPASRRLKLRSVFTFLDGQTADPLFSGACVQRPEPRRR
ncbi:MAG: hypothetical protein ACM3NV_00720 [Syntrophothermus sp.]